eukprot:CAMPEP_0170582160 /NCGR_PEP_ID=MMETSP0224-20130122/7430_1 /TAXON_ID=285029 /ORGANISM="Togula jolla, Strain CCCM 725" /LENGTH=642 /DNA_ID=CAMNT_0010905355 /DNA_START=24 /DNA_END=1952 /DNA_ORIENTATION=-
MHGLRTSGCGVRYARKSVVGLPLEEQQRDPWHGLHIRKQFGQRWFHGQVIGIDVDPLTGQRAYHVAYEDGDEEHLAEPELRTWAASSSRPSRPSSSAATALQRANRPRLSAPAPPLAPPASLPTLAAPPGSHEPFLAQKAGAPLLAAAGILCLACLVSFGMAGLGRPSEERQPEAWQGEGVHAFSSGGKGSVVPEIKISAPVVEELVAPWQETWALPSPSRSEERQVPAKSRPARASGASRAPAPAPAPEAAPWMEAFETGWLRGSALFLAIATELDLSGILDVLRQLPDLSGWVFALGMLLLLVGIVHMAAGCCCRSGPSPPLSQSSLHRQLSSGARPEAARSLLPGTASPRPSSPPRAGLDAEPAVPMGPLLQELQEAPFTNPRQEQQLPSPVPPTPARSKAGLSPLAGVVAMVPTPLRTNPRPSRTPGTLDRNAPTPFSCKTVLGPELHDQGRVQQGDVQGGHAPVSVSVSSSASPSPQASRTAAPSPQAKHPVKVGDCHVACIKGRDTVVKVISVDDPRRVEVALYQATVRGGRVTFSLSQGQNYEVCRSELSSEGFEIGIGGRAPKHITERFKKAAPPSAATPSSRQSCGSTVGRFRYQESLNKLLSMGLPDTADLRSAITYYRGDVQLVVQARLGR